MRPSLLLRQKANITGFDIKKLRDATGPVANDPWARAEAWRYTGMFSRWNRFKGAFPGFGIAAVAFAGYCGFEYFFLKDDHHAAGHGEEHH